MIILIEHHAKRNQPSTDFSTSDVSCLFTTFFAVLRSIDGKKKEKKKKK